MKPGNYLQHCSDSEVSRLLYRDTVELKHASRKRLASELASKNLATFDGPRLRDDPHPRTESSANPLVKALKDYLLEAWLGPFFGVNRLARSYNARSMMCCARQLWV